MRTIRSHLRPIWIPQSQYEGPICYYKLQSKYWENIIIKIEKFLKRNYCIFMLQINPTERMSTSECTCKHVSWTNRPYATKLVRYSIHRYIVLYTVTTYELYIELKLTCGANEPQLLITKRLPRTQGNQRKMLHVCF